MNRRAFLLGFSAAAGGVLLQLGGCGGGTSIEVVQALPPESVAIGKLYLKTRGDERARLGELLFAGDRWSGVKARSGEQVQTLIAEQVREDFQQGRVVTLDGWVLSETEGRLCALLA